MVKAISFALLLALAGCAGVSRSNASESACSAGEATYACQVERYHNVAAD